MRIIALRFLARRHFRGGPFNIHPSVRAGAFFDSFRWFNSRCSALRPIPRQIFVEKFRATIKTIVCVCVYVCMDAWRMKFDEESS